MMKKRQEMYFKGETLSPLLCYPEGTTTAGRHILAFKKGAFNALLPIKPYFISCNRAKNGIYVCPLTLPDHFYYTFCFLWTTVDFYEMPVIECTKYLLDTYKKEDEKDEDTYTRVVNLMYQEIHDLIPSDKTFKDLEEYERILSSRK